jgi:tRNA(Arg) A34 adenosine deaminase TadA
MMPNSLDFMRKALELAAQAASVGEVPVGCVIVKDGLVLASGRNEVMGLEDITAHAEIVTLRRACAIMGSRILTGCHLYVTLEPCPMCAQAISFSRIERVYYGAPDPKGGGIDHGPRVLAHAHHKPEVYGGICETEAGILLKTFFQDLR